MLDALTTVQTTIGFFTFGLTVLIWVKNYWEALQDIQNAPTQVRDQMPTLRQALYEEREYVRRKRAAEARDPRATPYQGVGPLKIINRAVKDLIKEFRSAEAPYLNNPNFSSDNPPPGRRHMGPKMADSSERELEWSYDAEQKYYSCSLYNRILWVFHTKAEIKLISYKLSIIQTRRIAIEVTDNSRMARELIGLLRSCEMRLAVIEDRLRISRIRDTGQGD